MSVTDHLTTLLMNHNPGMMMIMETRQPLHCNPLHSTRCIHTGFWPTNWNADNAAQKRWAARYVLQWGEFRCTNILREQAWIAAKDLFPNMSSSKLEVSYSAKGKLQVKMGAGKKLYNLVTTEKGAGREQINKSLPKEIKAALGQSKYERLQQVTYEKRKEINEKE